MRSFFKKYGSMIVLVLLLLNTFLLFNELYGWIEIAEGYSLIIRGGVAIALLISAISTLIIIKGDKK